jgi:hypothetical protein
MHDRRVNEKLAYHVRTAFPEKDKRSPIMKDRRVHRDIWSPLRALLNLPLSELWVRYILRRKK